MSTTYSERDSDDDCLQVYVFTPGWDEILQVSINRDDSGDGRFTAVNLTRKQVKALRRALKDALA